MAQLVQAQPHVAVHALRRDRPILVGRGQGCQITISVGQVSRHHARIDYTPEGWTITDLDSANGVYVNNQKVTFAVLRHHDTIAVGAGVFHFDESAPFVN